MKNYTRFLFALGKIGCIGFGGGSALIPIIEEEIIEKQQLDTKENFDKDVIVASITPGALPVEIAASLGRRNFGYKGMIMGPVMMALPGTLLTILLLTILSTAQARLLPAIELASVGVTAFIICLLTNYIIHMLSECKRESKQRLEKAIVIMLVVFSLTCGKNVYAVLGMEQVPVFSVSTFHILLAAFFCIFYSRNHYSIKNLTVMAVLSTIYLLSYGKSQVIHNVYVTHMVEVLMAGLSLWGVVQDARQEKWNCHIQRKVLRKDIGVWLCLLIAFLIPALIVNREVLEFAGNGILSAVMSFGGGDAYLTIADGLFVQNGMVTEYQYYGQVISIVNILPGSIMCKTLAGVGYYAGLNLEGTIFCGILYAIIGLVCSIVASCGFFSIVYYLYDSLIALRVFRMISRWIRPIIAGLLLNIIVSLCNQCIVAATDLNFDRTWIWGGVLALILIDFLWMKRFGRKLYGALILNFIVVFAVTAYI